MNKPNVQLYFIMGTENAGERDPLTVLASALKGGITTFQLREKGPNALTGDALKQFAEKCQALCAQYNVPFIINDDVELALEVGADGVHIGQDDGVVADVRKNWSRKVSRCFYAYLQRRLVQWTQAQLILGSVLFRNEV